MRGARGKRLFSRLVPSYVLITVVSLGAASGYAFWSMRQHHIEQLVDGLAARAVFLRERALAAQHDGDLSELDAACKRLGRETDTRFTIIDATGTVRCDSEAEPAALDNHADRPEVIVAMAGGRGVSRRYSHSVLHDMLYVAIPVVTDGATVGVARAAVPLTELDETLGAMALQIALGSVVVLLVATGLGAWVSRRLTAPLEDLQRGAEQVTQGVLEPLPEPDIAEYAALAQALNTMVDDLKHQLRALNEQRDELEGVLNGMVEGVLAVDKEERLFNVNPAACELLGIEPGEGLGRDIREVVRNPDLHRFIARLLQAKRVRKQELELRSAGGVERTLQLSGSPLVDRDGVPVGALIVLADVTQLRRLESMRRDFVANVSHELKTPITSIKGYAETLIDGALDEPEHARRFVEVIVRQSDRLQAIIDDLLALARVERLEEAEAVELLPHPLCQVIADAVEDCAAQAAEQQIELEVVCPDDMEAVLNPPLFEQALVNLMTNAIKYSERGGRVRVHADTGDREVRVAVIDWGPGIGEQHLPRLFERFYRVDPSRSREQGGTGLGLAIVKHIMQAHGGRVTVSSTPGEGSVFVLRLPVQGSEATAA